MTYPKTKKEWWELVNENWSVLLETLWKFLPMDGTEILKEDWNVVDTCLDKDPTRMAIHIEALRNDRNPLLAGYFQKAWSAAPDVPGLSEIPGWDILCDLCSENELLGKEEP